MSYIMKHYTIYYKLTNKQLMQLYSWKPVWKSLCHIISSQVFWTKSFVFKTKSVLLQRLWRTDIENSERLSYHGISTSSSETRINRLRAMLNERWFIKIITQCTNRDASITREPIVDKCHASMGEKISYLNVLKERRISICFVQIL